MKTLLAALAVVVMTASMASASRPVVRPGSDFDGYANPNGCRILVHDDEPNELHVNCKYADGAARIRYRYLKEYRGEFRPAGFTAEIERHGGDCSGVQTRWMVHTPRTGRVIIPAGCYAHIVSVRWDQ